MDVSTLKASKNMDSITPWLKALGLAGIAVLSPIHGVLIATLILIALDTFTGVWRAKVRGEKITSNGFRRTITKIVAYNLAILTGFVIQTFMIPAIAITSLIAAAIAVTEGKSILENLSEITGVDLLSAVKEKLMGKKDQGEK